MDKSNQIIMIIVVIVFIVIFYSIGFNTARSDYEKKFTKWAIEQEYVQYNHKTGDLQIINNDIEPVKNLLYKKE